MRNAGAADAAGRRGAWVVVYERCGAVLAGRAVAGISGWPARSRQQHVRKVDRTEFIVCNWFYSVSVSHPVVGVLGYWWFETTF